MLIEYFGEDASAAVTEEGCCDVYLGQPEMMNYQEKALAIIQFVQEIPRHGEQKVNNEVDKQVISSGQWLNDNIISAWQRMLTQKFPEIAGLENTIKKKQQDFVLKRGGLFKL